MAIQPSTGVSNREPWVFVNTQGFPFRVFVSGLTSKLLGILDVCSCIVGEQCSALVDCTQSW